MLNEGRPDHPKKVDLAELKEMKVKIPVRLLINLHYMKLTRSRPISDVVNEALTEYFAHTLATRKPDAAVQSSETESWTQAGNDEKAEPVAP
jgi:hypothetical protein